MSKNYKNRLGVIKMNERLLIISNNVLSETNNNGKTILSYIDCLPKSEVRQLYFSSENPQIEGYEYFQISDKDVLKGHVRKIDRGRSIKQFSYSENKTNSNIIKRNDFTCLLREIIWYKSWKSEALINWLDDYNPTAVFFVGGDCLFAYNIYLFIVKRYSPKSSLYLTDDYIAPRKKKTFLSEIRRKLIINKLQESLKLTHHFFTISAPMKQAYNVLLNRNSDIIVNMTESLYSHEYIKSGENIAIVYAGSLYYGRDDVLLAVADAIERYNVNNNKKVFLEVYSKDKINNNKLKNFSFTHFNGPVNKEKLIKIYNAADILLFVESFNDYQIEKTRYSLSTKVPEYLSLKKPIFAVGPDNIGSMDYLQDVAQCVYKLDDIYKKLVDLLESHELQLKLAKSSYIKYVKYNNKEKMQEKFIKKIFE